MRDWKAVLQVTRSSALLLVTSEVGDVLKARLPLSPSHPRALLTLLEGLSLWDGEPLTPEKLKKGLEEVKDFNAQGLIPPITLTADDHQGGGRGRISQWDGTKWVPKTDWYAAYQDVVWGLVKKNAEEFKKQN